MTHGPIRQEYAYDLDKNLTGLTVRSGDTLLAQTSYAYDGNGNRTRKQALDGTTLYQYDALNQLQRVDYPAYSEELFYDKAGNRARRLLDGEEELYQYDPRNRLMALTRGGVTTPFQYDRAGNLLQDDKAKYTYDAFNRTVKVETFDGNIQLNRYDAEGLRHEMEENGNLVQFIFNQEREVVTEEDSTGLTRLIRSTELIARSSDGESARTYYHYASDEMGSTTHIVDDAGTVQNRYEYDAWGNLTAQEEAIPNRFKYTGQQLDPVTQQYYLRARFYNPVIARFTQEDTYRGDGLNLYAYCANNPVFYIDPTGNEKDVLGTGQTFADRLEQHVQEELKFNEEHGLTTYYDTPEARAQNERIASNRPANPQANTPTAESTIRTRDIYRAVSPEEFDDIFTVRGFRACPDGRSFQAKEFGNSFDETLEFANKPINLDKAAIVKVTIPEDVYSQLNHMNLDRVIFKSGTPVVEPEMLDKFNESIISIEHVF